MTFTVTHRGANGAPVTEVVEASDRAECLARLKARGIAATSVKEGEISGSDGSERRVGRDKGGHGRKPIIAYVVSVALVTLVAGGIWWCLKETKVQAVPELTLERKKTSLVKEVKPAIVKTERLQNISNNNRETLVDSAEMAAPITNDNPKRLTFKQRFGRGRTITNRLNAAQARYAVFRHKSENELAVLSCLPVGSPVIGNKEYDEEFMSDLEEALKEKIEITDDDTPEIKKYKEAVIAVKEQIRNLKSQGLDVAAILTDTRRELQDLGVYRAKLERQIADIQREDESLTDQDVADFVAAANLMLEAKGIEPIEFNPLTREIIKRVPFAPAPKDLDD